MLVLEDGEASARGTLPAAVGLEPARPALRQQARLLEDPEISLALHMQAFARAVAGGWPLPASEALAAGVQAVRLAAGRSLLERASAFELLAVARCIAGDDEVGTTLRQEAARHRGFRTRVRAALQEGCDPSLCALAVQLGDPDLDRRVLSLCRRDEARADAVAAACARRPGARVAFLLELWAVVTRGGDDGGEPARDELARARAWFAPLPPPATDELLQHLASTRSAEVRERVFLALGARGDRAAVEPLLAWVDSPNAMAAALAAYALGCCDAPAARLEAAARTSRRPELLWAALASQGHGDLRARLQRLGLPPAPADLLPTGRFRPEQIRAVAALLRGRGAGTATGRALRRPFPTES
jgi:hypothetical protein